MQYLYTNKQHITIHKYMNTLRYEFQTLHKSLYLPMNECSQKSTEPTKNTFKYSCYTKHAHTIFIKCISHTK